MSMAIRGPQAEEKPAPYGATIALVLLFVKSNRSNADDAEEGANRHCCAAFSAKFAKNWLTAGESSSAEETDPSAFSCTRTLMRTVPRMVFRAFCETSGNT